MYCQVTADTDSHYARQARQELKEMQAERITQRAEEICGELTGRDTSELIGEIAEHNQPLFERFCEQLASLQAIAPATQRPMIRGLAETFQTMTFEWAKTVARKELEL